MGERGRYIRSKVFYLWHMGLFHNKAVQRLLAGDVAWIVDVCCFRQYNWIGLGLQRAPEIRRNTKDPSFEQAQAGTFAYAAMLLAQH